tara:strand:+ start:2692 stop:2907 length:216 start_codon:yes stop_codon:yes gene_type:complete
VLAGSLARPRWLACVQKKSANRKIALLRKVFPLGKTALWGVVDPLRLYAQDSLKESHYANSPQEGNAFANQ